jgi:hypothetical protein
MIEGQLRNEIAKLKESRARLATRLQVTPPHAAPPTPRPRPAHAPPTPRPA